MKYFDSEVEEVDRPLHSCCDICLERCTVELWYMTL